MPAGAEHDGRHRRHGSGRVDPSRMKRAEVDVPPPSTWPWGKGSPPSLGACWWRGAVVPCERTDDASTCGRRSREAHRHGPAAHPPQAQHPLLGIGHMRDRRLIHRLPHGLRPLPPWPSSGCQCSGASWVTLQPVSRWPTASLGAGVSIGPLKCFQLDGHTLVRWKRPGVSGPAVVGAGAAVVCLGCGWEGCRRREPSCRPLSSVGWRVRNGTVSDTPGGQSSPSLICRAVAGRNTNCADKFATE